MKILVLSDLHLEFTAFEPDGEAIGAADGNWAEVYQS